MTNGELMVLSVDCACLVFFQDKLLNVYLIYKPLPGLLGLLTMWVPGPCPGKPIKLQL